jgi:hypothetical protein
MARTTEEINAIIAELKTRRNTRDAAIESAAAALDSSDAKNAARLRSLKHVKEIANDTDVCQSCTVIKNGAGDIMAMSHVSYNIENQVVGGETDAGLKTLLVDESFTVTGATTVENL